MTHVKWSTETNQIDNQYLRDYDNMRRQIEDKQNEEYYKTQRQIHNAIMGDTLSKQHITDSKLIIYLLMIVIYKEFPNQCTTS